MWSYFIGTFKDGKKNGKGTWTYPSNSTSITGTWINDKYTGECFNQLEAIASKPDVVTYDFTPSGKPYVSTIKTDSYFKNLNAKTCPITECQVMDSTCKAPLKNVSVDNKFPFSLSAVTNVKLGYADTVCLICKNKHDSASIYITYEQ
jgi:hypothetical protein